MSATTSTHALSQQQIANLAVYALATAILMGVQQVTPENHLPLIEKTLEEGRIAIMAQVAALMEKDPVLATTTTGPDLEAASIQTAVQGLQIIQQVLATIKV